MDSFYDHGRFSQEIFFDELQIGQRFPPFCYRLSKAHIDFYLQSVEDSPEGGASAQPFVAAERSGRADVATSLAAFNYGFFYSAMGRRPPTGYINSAVEFDFLHKVPVNSELTMLVSVDQKFVKRERKYVVFRLEVHGAHEEREELLAAARVDCIFPR